LQPSKLSLTIGTCVEVPSDIGLRPLSPSRRTLSPDTPLICGINYPFLLLVVKLPKAWFFFLLGKPFNKGQPIIFPFPKARATLFSCGALNHLFLLSPLQAHLFEWAILLPSPFQRGDFYPGPPNLTLRNIPPQVSSFKSARPPQFLRPSPTPGRFRWPKGTLQFSSDYSFDSFRAPGRRFDPLISFALFSLTTHPFLWRFPGLFSQPRFQKGNRDVLPTIVCHKLVEFIALSDSSKTPLFFTIPIEALFVPTMRS